MSIKAYGTITVINVDDGAKGEKGDTGATISSVTPMYYLSTSNTELKGGSWSTTKPEVTTGKYLFTKQVTTLTDGTTKESKAIYDATITGIESRVSNTEQNITDKVWQSDITTAINEYDGTTGSSIRDRVTQTETDINGISSTVSDLSTTVSGNTTSITNLRTEYNQTAEGFNWLVQKNSQSSSYEITSDGIQAITNKFVIKDPEGKETIISGGQIHTNAITTEMLATDAIKSTNYTKSSSNTSAYSNTGSFFNLSTGSIETPNFGVDNTNGKAYLNGEIIATSGQIGDSSNNYWEIGTKTDYNAATSAAIIAHGSSYIQSGQFMIHDDKVNTQSYDSNRKITYPKYNNVYYDFGMQAPQLDTTASGYIAGISDLFLYARKHNNTIPTMESDWKYVFKVDKDGTIYENGVKLSEKYASIDGVSGAYLPLGGGTITGNLTVNGTITGTLSGTASNANTVNNLTVKTAVPANAVFTDTKNTAGSTNSTSKLFLIGATSQGNNPTTNSNVNVYTSGGKLYSNKIEVVTLSDTQALTNKTYEGYTLADASAKGVDTSLTATSASTNLPTSAAVANLISNYLPLSGGTITGDITGNLIGNADTATSLTTSAGSDTQPVYFKDGIPVITKYSLEKSVPSNAVFTDTNWYHTSGTWNGLKYTANKSNSSMGALEFTIPTGTTASTVAVGNHTHSNYASKITLAGTDYSVSNNVITITQAKLQTAVQSSDLVLMTSSERSKLGSIQVSDGGTIDFSGVTAESPLTATVATNKTVHITHDISGVSANTYRSVTVDKYGHVTAGTNPTTLSGYGITDAKIASGTITLGSNTITPLTASSTLDATKLSGTASISTTGNAKTATTAASATTAESLTNKTLNSTTINNTAGSFTFEGSGDPWSDTDWVGLQVGSNTDKFQLHASNSTTLEYRQNDNGGTNATWSNWYPLLSSGNYTSYTVTKTGVGASGTWDIGISGNAATATKATQDSDGNTINSTYLKLSGGTVTGTLVLSKTTDLSGTANNSPALIVGGTATTQHMEIDSNEIHAKTNGTSVAPLNLNLDGGIIYTGTGGINTKGTVTIGSHSRLTYNSTYNCLEFSFV